MIRGTRGSNRARLRQWLGPTDAPARWDLVAAAAAGVAVGAGVGAMVAPARGAILSGLIAGLVAAAGASGPPPIALRLSGLAAVFGLVAAGLAFGTAGHPVWAALAMAAVAIAATVATGTGPIGAALGVLGLLSYVLAVALSTMASLRPTVSFASGVVHIGLGCAAGLLVTLIAVAVRAVRHHAPFPGAGALPPLWRPMARSLRTFDVHARDGIRRAIPLALGVYLFESSGSRDALWIFVAAFVVLLPAGKPPVVVMIVRAITTVVAVLTLGLLTLVVSHEALFGVAIVAVLVGMAYANRYPLPASSATTMGAILLAAAPTGAIGTWATHRLVDTMIGCGLALAATYLLWPRDLSAADPPPA